MKKFILILLVGFYTAPRQCLAIVKYDEGRIEIDGIQLFQDSQNENGYFYVPPHPRVSTLANGDFEFLCAKYVGNGNESSGGLFHVLVQFSLTPEETTELEKKLKAKFPDAFLMGPVSMMDNEGPQSAASFRIVSSILKDSSRNQFTLGLISSGKAPFLPGSKAAIAAHLTQDGATLLWESFQGVTSDVSVVVDGYFRALVKGYKATVQADLALVYEHFSSFRNVQSGFTKVEATHILDSLCKSGTIKIDVADMSKGLDIDTDAYQNILSIITEKIVDAMFNVDHGWAKLPITETPAAPHDLKGRYQRGAFVRFFAGDGTQNYVPDDQLILKTKKEIRNFHFFLDLNQSTVINVPVYSAGNIHGFYNEYKNDKRYFRIIDMNDPDFQIRDIHFQIDGGFVNSFGEILDQVTILVEKDYTEGQGHAYSGSVLFNKAKIDSGNVIQSLAYQRMGDRTNDWLKFRYKVGWKFIGIDSLITTPGNDWLTSSAPAITVVPPLQKKEIEIGLNKQLLKENGIQSIRIRFASILFNKPYKGKTLVIRTNEAAESLKTSVYHDKDQAVVYQISWFTNTKQMQDDLLILKDDYLFLIPPQTN